MESILNQILTQKHAEELRSFDPVQVVRTLLAELSDREREIIDRRFALEQFGEVAQTLEEIGQTLKITRERVRQVIKSSLVKLSAAQSQHPEVQQLFHVAEQLLKSLGGAAEEASFLRELAEATGSPVDPKSRAATLRYLQFMLKYVGGGTLEVRPATESRRSIYALGSFREELLEKALHELRVAIEKNDEPLSIEEIQNEFLGTQFAIEHQVDLFTSPTLAWREYFTSSASQESPSTEEKRRIVAGYLEMAQGVAKNIFEDWGKESWTSIHPRRMNDKIFLVLRHEGKPLHFTAISDRVNAAHFDAKIARPPSVHNELILDKRFVLVGRGMYALEEWGYKQGTVADVVRSILANGPLARQQVIDAVLKQRFVKPQTVVLALMNQEEFQKMSDGRYRVIEKK